MGQFKAFVVAGSLALCSASAFAADMPSLPFPQLTEKSVAPVREYYSGWYLRGDLGYRLQDVEGATTAVPPSPTDNSIEDSFGGGLGAGYKARWFRFDVTGDYFSPSTYTGTVAGTTTTAKIDSYTVMANGYVDLGTWAGLTPYVGAGIGVARLSMSDYETAPVATATGPSTSSWNMAWAVMAGVSYQLTYNFLVDVSYRHIEMGDITGGPAANNLTIEGLKGDEVRIGIRYLLD